MNQTLSNCLLIRTFILPAFSSLDDFLWKLLTVLACITWMIMATIPIRAKILNSFMTIWLQQAYIVNWWLMVQKMKCCQFLMSIDVCCVYPSVRPSGNDLSIAEWRWNHFYGLRFVSQPCPIDRFASMNYLYFVKSTYVPKS